MNSTRVVAALRILFGLHFLLNGLNYTFHFFEIPRPPVEMANLLHDTMVDSGLFAIAKLVEVVTGLMLIFNVYVPVALVVAFPVTIVIAFMDMYVIGTAWMGAFIAGLLTLVVNVVLLIAYARYYRPMLERRATPGL